VLLLLPGLFDELDKIAEDLMTPAVTAESNLVQGPPASPWTRRRGFRKLEKTTVPKETGATGP